MIFKIQIPLVTNERFPHALIYNSDRSVEFIVPVGEVEEWFIEDFYKIYVDASYSRDPNGKFDLMIHEIVEDEEW